MHKVVAINSSPRKNGNTAAMIDTIFSVLDERPDITCETVHIGGRSFHGCRGCYLCKKNQDQKCIITDDYVNDCIAKMVDADVIILGSPTYYSTLTSEMKALIDRAGTVTRGNGNLLEHKIGVALSPVRRAGGMNTIQTMNNLFLLSNMIIPGSTSWNMALARNVGDLASDEEGIATMKNLGEQILWLLDRIA